MSKREPIMIPAPTEYSRARANSPSSTMAVLAVVPPMSKVIILDRFLARARACAPTTPPAGPDSMMFIGRSAAAISVVRPPLDCIKSKRAGIPAASRPLRNACRYPATMGITYALTTVVEVRSYSFISGRISQEMLIGRLGAFLWMMFLIASS